MLCQEYIKRKGINEICNLKCVKQSIYCSYHKFRNKKDNKDENYQNIINKEQIKIYVDGSYSNKMKSYSYGFVVIDNDKIIYQEKKNFYDIEGVALRNVSGELKGSEEAINYALNNNYKSIEICFDYEGIRSWALGLWRRNNNITKNYHYFIQNKINLIEINFIKVKSHSNNIYNNLADKLAKEALNILK